MSARKKLAALAGGALALAAAYQLAPLSSADHAIAFDEDAIARKGAFLETLRGAPSVEANRPNIILLLADDLGKTDISLYGGTAVQTPYMDSIGQRGVTFTDAYCTSSICSPSRAAIITGRYPQRFGFETQPNNRYPRNRLEYNVYRNFMNMGNWQPQDMESVPRQEDILNQGLPPSELTLSELLQANGYATGLSGKWHLGYAEPFQPTNRGFDSFYGFYEAFTLYSPVDDPDIVNYRHDYFASKHIWAQGRDGTCAIRRDEQIVEEDEYLTFAIAREANAFIESHHAQPFFLFVSFSAPHTPFQAPREYYDQFTHVDDENKRVYYAMIAALDDAVGQILAQVEELKLSDNTLIWFASDNGGATYTGATDNAPLTGGKFNHFEGGVNVPMMLRWPGPIPADTVYEHPVSLMDLFSTSAAVAQAPMPDDRAYDGADLMPYITGETSDSPHEALFWRTHHMKAARAGEWKLIRDNRDDRSWLYNVEDDESEKLNHAQEQHGVVETLTEKLRVWESGLEAPLWPYLVEYQFKINGENFSYPL
jgi:arylsulfatase A-like enzyme